MFWSDRMPWKALYTCNHLLCFQIACHHLFLVLLIDLSCAFNGPPPIPGYYDLLYMLDDQTTGVSGNFIRLFNYRDETYPNEIPVVSTENPIILLAWTHLPETADPFDNDTFPAGRENGLTDALYVFHTGLGYYDAVVNLVQLDEATYLNQLNPESLGNWTMVQNSRIGRTDENVCSLMYYCLFHTELNFTDPATNFYTCLEHKYNLSRDKIRSATWRCYIPVSLNEYETFDLTEHALNGNLTKVPCSNEDYDITQANWMHWDVDFNLQISLKGGVDTQGVYWEGGKINHSFAETIGRQFWDWPAVKCTRANPCQRDLDCTRIGSYTAIALGRSERPLSLPWVLLASSAIININQQLVNQYDQLENAIESLALDTFTIDDFFPKKNQNPSLQNSLTGLSGIFTILGGFIPVGGPAIEAAGTVASSIGTFLANSVSSTDPAEAQDIFSEKVLVLYRGLLIAMEDVIEKLFNGDELHVDPSLGSSSFNISGLMEGGAWVDPNAITNISQLNAKVRTEILSRSIDSLWKTPPSNKMWVLYTDLKDDANATKCNEDKTGPFDSKYCGDGGVYYTYNFIEQQGGGGGVGWPWGADQLAPRAGVNLTWVTEASAKSYQLMKQLHLDPFNFTQTLGTATYLNQTFTHRPEGKDLSEMYGRYPGSWTLPVCNASDWGSRWNWDYTGVNSQVREAYYTHPPCLCGPQALETYDWARAAGMQDFETFWYRCKEILHASDFTWPEGVTFVNYPANVPKVDFHVWKS